MKCFIKAKIPENLSFLNSLKKFKKAKKIGGNDVIFVTKDTIHKIKGLDVNIVLLTNVPSFEEFISYYKEYPKIVAYTNVYTRDIHYKSILDTIKQNKIWLVPHVKKELDVMLTLKNKINKSWKSAFIFLF